MLTYQVRDRLFIMQREGDRASFPADVFVRFTFAPATPFGGSVEPSRTLKQGATGQANWDSNTGRQWVVGGEPLDPVDVTITFPDLILQFDGAVLTATRRFESLDQLASLIEGIHYGLPLLLNLDLVDAPGIAVVDGEVDGKPFHWGLAGARDMFDLTNTTRQEERIARAFERFKLINTAQNRRLIAALHSFRIACRLATGVQTPLDFSAERILNLAKTLEALFPGPEGETIGAARNGLKTLNYSVDEVEAWFIPALALRNQIDVGHVFLGILNQEQLRILHDYVDGAEGRFRDLLGRVCDGIEDGSFQLPTHNDSGPKRKVISIIERVERAKTRLSSTTAHKPKGRPVKRQPRSKKADQ